MGQVHCNRIKEEIWGRVETSLDGYSDVIERCLSCMTEEQLNDLLTSFRDRGACEQCGASCEYDSCLCVCENCSENT